MVRRVVMVRVLRDGRRRRRRCRDGISVALLFIFSFPWDCIYFFFSHLVPAFFSFARSMTKMEILPEYVSLSFGRVKLTPSAAVQHNGEMASADDVEAHNRRHTIQVDPCRAMFRR